MTTAPILSTLFRATLSAVDTASQGMGAAVVESIRVGFAEYLTPEDFVQAYKAGVSPKTWSTVTNYMAPIKRAWLSSRIEEYCSTAEEKGIKAANGLFPAGTGKKGAPGKVETTTTEAETIASPSVLSQADAIIAAMFEADELESLKAENALLLAKVDELTRDLLVAYAKIDTFKTKGKDKKQAVSA